MFEKMFEIYNRVIKTRLLIILRCGNEVKDEKLYFWSLQCSSVGVKP